MREERQKTLAALGELFTELRAVSVEWSREHAECARATQEVECAAYEELLGSLDRLEDLGDEHDRKQAAKMAKALRGAIGSWARATNRDLTEAVKRRAERERAIVDAFERAMGRVPAPAAAPQDGPNGAAAAAPPGDGANEENASC